MIDPVAYLKENFSDCTFGGEDETYIKYDIGLEETFAHVDINKHEREIIIKIYDPDSVLLSEEKMKYITDAVKFLNLPTWRQIWNRRRKLTCAGTKDQVEKWIEKHKHEYDEPIYIDSHPKDDWVAYLEPKSI